MFSMSNLPVKNSISGFPTRMRVMDTVLIDFRVKPWSNSNKIIFVPLNKKHHLTIGFYDKPEVLEIDFHLTFHKDNSHRPLAKMKMMKARIAELVDKNTDKISKEADEALKNNMRLISLPEIRKLKYPLMPLGAINPEIIGTKELRLNSMKDMRQKLGGPIKAKEFKDTNIAAMILSERTKSAIRSMNVIIKKEGLYYTLNLFDLLKNMITLISIFDEAMVFEIYDKTGATIKTVSFREMIESFAS